jgi:hypothetical protein
MKKLLITLLEDSIKNNETHTTSSILEYFKNDYLEGSGDEESAQIYNKNIT